MIKPRIVIKLSGSLFNFETNSEQLNDYIQLIKKISNVYQPIIVTGGGKIARFYINLSRSLGMDESGLDLIGIQVSQLNARLLISGLAEYCYPLPPRNLEEISVALLSGLVLVTGGIYPGQSTNATSALIAERVGATKFYNATDVDGIYDSDPRTNPDAKKYDTINVQDCVNILKSEKSMAGTYDLMDLISLKVIERSKLPTIVFKSTLDNIEKVVLEKDKMGTEIII
ncbi:UMP kinase [Candidatus Nitrosocosmicus arcticus]|uniref:Uridylate kinase n=1 Tax=Candidatus Nitrosocosmicus arcticus TaxID=2035267 RepID=A0A557SYW1_9ARCH|nr:UMP kinase [Candidatus Nitrosocosmicus arcticus]TVP41773.1 Uridylate kinase [Candidatus Nitrosocosmicus arcticus]